LLEWEDAQSECKKKYFNSELLDTNEYDLNELINYLYKTNQLEHLSKIHIKIKSTQRHHQPDQDASEQSNEVNKKKLKLKLCQSQSVKEKALYNNLLHKNANLSELDDSLIDDDLATYLDYKKKENLKYTSIKISYENNVNDEDEIKNYDHCIEVNSKKKKLAFICKFETRNKKNIDDDVSDDDDDMNDFYPDTLRDYIQDPKMSYVMNSLLAIVNGLDKAHQIVINF
jgi:hypothetical protein